MSTTFCTPLDNVATTLASGFTAGGTSIVLTTGTGTLFGSPSPSAPVRVTLIAASALDTAGRITDRTKVANLKATGRTGDTLTGVTFDSGTAQNFAANDVAAVLVDATSLSDIHAAVNALEAGGGGGGGSGTVTTVSVVSANGLGGTV